MYSLYFVQNIINLKILKEFYCESYLQSQKFHTNSGKLNLTLLLNLLTLFMTFGILISGAIPAPFDLAMSTNSSKVTKEYLLSKLGFSPLVFCFLSNCFSSATSKSIMKKLSIMSPVKKISQNQMGIFTSQSFSERPFCSPF